MAQQHPFGDRAAQAAQEKQSCVVVGLDPVLSELPEEVTRRAASPAESIQRFCEAIVEATRDAAAAVKPQAAFFERYGARGWEALERICLAAQQAGLLVILDAKRGDIGSTARAYAEGLLGDTALGNCVDAMTMNPYLGTDSVQPFLEIAAQRGKGLFVLTRTSNPSSAELQLLPVAEPDGTRVPLYEKVGALVARWGEGLIGSSGYSSVGAVVGATWPQEVARVRELLPNSWLLLPGYGAQGAGPEQVAAAFDDKRSGALVNAARSIIYAYKRDDLSRPYAPREFAEAAREAAVKMRDELRAAAAATLKSQEARA